MWECGLKLPTPGNCRKRLTSLLMWECGLKRLDGVEHSASVKSLLMWECGLKLCVTDISDNACTVTPYVGVWIETCLII